MTAKNGATLESAQRERDRLAAETRAQDEIVDKLAAERWEALTAKRQAWARSADQAATAATLAKAETVARRAFQAAAVTGDARSAYLAWTDARNAVNQQRDRIVQARSYLGEAQDEMGYPIRDVPSYSAELDRALTAEASSRWSDRQDEFQAELNDLDQLT